MAIGYEKQELPPYVVGIDPGGQDQTVKSIGVAGLGRRFGQLLKEYWKAEDALASLRALQAFGPKAKDLEKQAIELARTTGYTLAEAAEALKYRALEEINSKARQCGKSDLRGALLTVDQPRKPARRKGRRK